MYNVQSRPLERSAVSTNKWLYEGFVTVMDAQNGDSVRKSERRAFYGNGPDCLIITEGDVPAPPGNIFEAPVFQQGVEITYDSFGRVRDAYVAVGRPAGFDSGVYFVYGYKPGTDLVCSFGSEYWDPDSYGAAVVRSVSYEPRRDLVSAVSNLWYTTPVSSYTYVNDATGRRTARLDTVGAVATGNAFGYNKRSEVTNAVMGETAYSYSYDDIGNRRQSAVSVGNGQPDVLAYAANALNQYTNLQSTAYSLQPSYDLDGNMLTNGVWTYTWDAENRLVSACSNNVLLVTNVYDHLSRRIRKEVYVRGYPPTAYSLRSTSRFLYDGWKPVREIRDAFAPSALCTTNYYTWGLDLSGTPQGAGGVGGLVAVTSVACVPGEEPAVATYFPAYDANGNIVQYFDEAGEAVAGFEYDAFGNTVATSGNQADAFAHRFSTKCFDAETGLYCYGYRFYSPELGRWVSRDPIGEEGGLNEVAFLENSSVNVYDLMGLFGSSIHLRATSDWAMELGVDKKVASIIGREDDGVDTQYSAYPPFTERNWGWHFNRALGVDSRLAHASEMFTKAKRYCTGGQDDAESAAKNLGIGLHPLQDWVAHGDFNSMNDMPNITQIKSKIKALKYAHNYYGHTRFARREIEDAISHVDDEALDANGPGGRATRSVLVERSRASGNIFFATDFHNGNERLTLTRDKTKEYLAEFILYVKRNGKPCGECQKKFLKQSNP